MDLELTTKKQNSQLTTQKIQANLKEYSKFLKNNDEDFFDSPFNKSIQLKKEEDCRKFFPDYETLLQSYMSLDYKYYTLWILMDTLLNLIDLISQTSNRSFSQQARPKLFQNKRARRDPMSIKIYDALLKATKGSTYSKIRLRVALCILFVTGISLNTLLFLRVSQLITLREKGWITVDHDSLESSSWKAHLTKIGKAILRDREEDFTGLFLTKTSDDFVFTSQRKPYKRLTRETLTREINKITSYVSKELVEKPNITTYSFRIGDIALLWKEPKDIKFVRDALRFNKNN